MPYLRPARRPVILLCMVFTLIFAVLSSAIPAQGQSTFGNIVGTVTDATGATIPNATVILLNKGTSSRRTLATNSSGEYSFNILDAGDYEITVESAGFSKSDFADIHLLARETRRVDASLHVGSEVQTVEVSSALGSVITTETSSLSTTKTGEQLVDLPVAIFAHSNGSTSPISTLTTNPGVQTDDSGNLVIAGATPALLSVTIDGISSVNVEYSGPLNELFPSFNSISEIRVSETNNNAEYSGVADITTTSRGGTNSFHGGIFENHENTVLNAGNPFTGGKPKIIMNNFGGFLGGPLSVPGLYKGRDKTFFFGSFEALRLPREVPIVTSVPSLAMRAGNLTSYLAAQGVSGVNNYDGITALDPSKVPVSPTAANFLKTFFPLPNRGGLDDYQNNYSVNFPAPISSNQGDLRLDQNFTSKQTAFLRMTYKKRSVTTAPNPNATYNTSSGSTLTGAYAQPETDIGLTLAHTYLITPSIINEFRAGFNLNRVDTTFNATTTGLLAATGITGVNDPDPVPEAPNVLISGFMNTGGGTSSRQRSKVIQVIDNLTLTRGGHTIKFGGDFRRLTDHDDNVFGAYRSGQYNFNGSTAIGTAIGDPYAQFLLGYPDYTILAHVTNPNMDGLGFSYAAFAQDDWKITPTLTLNFGFRYELHPPLKEINYNTAAFDPTYANGSTRGAVVVPNSKALAFTEPLFAQAIGSTPILTAAQDNLPDALRYTVKTDFGPRIGFAWRPFAKTVIRGGYGRFIESPLGFSLVSGWSVSASFVPQYYNGYDAGGAPLLSFPSPFPVDRGAPGTASFQYAFPIHYKDPSVQQWNLTYERELGFHTGLRLSYTGSRGSNLETFEDLNQVHPSTAAYDPTTRPFQDWQILQSVYNAAESNYNSFSAVVEKQTSNGLQFQSSYVFTRDLSNEAGANPTSFVGAGGNYLTDRFNPGLDYGNVTYDRRSRFLTTGLYDLPFGHNKHFASTGGRLVEDLVGGWQLGGVFIWQSGPFLTPYETSDDPAGTNEINVVGSTRPDRVANVPLYTRASVGSNPVFFNAAAFTLTGSNIGRFGNAAVGSLVGPGTVALSSSLLKAVSLTEALKVQLGISAANLFNHRNYEPPDTQLDSGSFGQSSALQTAEGTGPRNIQITARISF